MQSGVCFFFLIYILSAGIYWKQYDIISVYMIRNRHIICALPSTYKTTSADGCMNPALRKMTLRIRPAAIIPSQCFFRWRKCLGRSVKCCGQCHRGLERCAIHFPETAHRLGYDLSIHFSKSDHVFIAATHTGPHHVHKHIIISTAGLNRSQTYRDFQESQNDAGQAQQYHLTGARLFRNQTILTSRQVLQQIAGQ